MGIYRRKRKYITAYASQSGGYASAAGGGDKEDRDVIADQPIDSD